MKKEFRFDIRGYLQPAERILTTVDELKGNFVDAFEESDSKLNLVIYHGS